MPGRDLGAVRERDPGRPAAVHQDLRDRSAGGDLHPGGPAGRGDRAADRAHPAQHVAEEPLLRVLAAGQQVEGQAD